MPAHPTAEQRASLEKWTDNDNKAKYYMLGTMSDDLQRQYKNILTTCQMLANLQELFGEQSRRPSIKSVKDFLRPRCMMGSQSKIIV